MHRSPEIRSTKIREHYIFVLKETQLVKMKFKQTLSIKVIKNINFRLDVAFDTAIG